MVVITKAALHEFVKVHPPAAQPLNDWFFKTKAADWSNFMEMKQTFNSVDAIGKDRYVFNIGGHNYRLIAMIHFGIRTLYVRRILTHGDYTVLSNLGALNTL